MGNLLRLLARPDDSDNYNIFLDFENAQPTEVEIEAFNEVKSILARAPQLLTDLQSYVGAGKEIREAISSPNDDQLQDKAWTSVCPLVARLKQYYEYSLELDVAVQKLLNILCSSDMDPLQHLETQQSSAKQFAEILDFTFKFDDLKMTNPAIQNDFSYYRRTLSRMKMTSQEDDQGMTVNNEMANRMSLFYAQATPMLKTLSDATIKFVSDNKQIPLENTTAILSKMTAVCRVMLENSEHYSRFQSEDTLLFVLRVMVGLVILYDHVYPVGAFAKNSGIDVKSCIKLLKDQKQNKVEGLLNALRYTTKHLNDETTPSAIRNMLVL